MKKDGIKKSSIFTKGMVVLTAVSMLGMTGCSNIAVNKPEQDQELSSENTDHNDAVDEQNDTKNSAKIKWEEIGAENKEDKKTSKQDDSDSTEVDEILEELSSGSSEMLSEDEMELLSFGRFVSSPNSGLMEKPVSLEEKSLNTYWSE